ncbi:NAD-P-binding protein [Trametes meyenii]|nr:NAD-P-binding protein [Trametes meyenii]
MTVSYAIIGAARGIGLEFVQQLLRRANTTVFAVVRHKLASTHLTAAIASANNVHIIEADITDHRSLARAAQEIAAINGGSLDYLIHNAARMVTATISYGFDQYKDPDELEADFIDAFRVNTIGVIHSITAFLPLLRAGSAKKIIVIGSGGGDPHFVQVSGIADMAAYGTTKAAQVLVTTKWALKLKDEGFVVITLSPGLVDTTQTFGESVAPEVRENFQNAITLFKAAGLSIEVQTPEQSVREQLRVIDGLKESDNGAFLRHNGTSFR